VTVLSHLTQRTEGMRPLLGAPKIQWIYSIVTIMIISGMMLMDVNGDWTTDQQRGIVNLFHSVILQLWSVDCL
jgi:hypothetical protein